MLAPANSEDADMEILSLTMLVLGSSLSTRKDSESGDGGDVVLVVNYDAKGFSEVMMIKGSRW